VTECISHGSAWPTLPSPVHQVAVLNPPLRLKYPPFLKLGEGGALHFYARVAVYIRNTYYVPIGKAGGSVHLVAVKEAVRLYAQSTFP